MTTLTEFMSDDHHRCDDLFAAAEAAAGDARWDEAQRAHDTFLAAMKSHFAMEEEGLFPAFEEASGTRMGPTAVMRLEHEQMCGLFAQMTAALSACDGDNYLGAAETLLILMQQHNAKEEQILYPMSDRMLTTNSESLLMQMQRIGGLSG